MLVATFDSVAAIYMPGIMDMLRRIFENLPYNHIDFSCVSRKIIRLSVF